MGINVWVPAVTALTATALGAWLLDHFAGRRWQSQQQWAVREKRYTDLLAQLTKAEMSLQRQSDYYMRPGSEHDDNSKDERFLRLGRAAAEALHSIEELSGPAGLFLSQKAIDALDELIREDWHAGFDAAHPGEYIEKALPLVRNAQAAVLAAGRSEHRGGQRVESRR